jgi:AraC-like DNA-binding protein
MAMRAAGETSYREVRPPAGLGGDLVCSWVGSIGPEGPPAIDRVLPDGCVDVVWNGERLFVAGPDETAVPLERRPGSAIVGVRLKPARAPALLCTAASELTGLRVDLGEFWGCAAGEIAARLEEAASAEAARRLLESRIAVRVAEAGAADAAIAALVSALAADARPIAGLAQKLGLSRRHLQRRSLVALGYGPKTFARIMRFQRFLALGRRSPEAQLAALAREAGYADQAHLGRECRRLAGLTPRELLVWQRRVPFVQDDRALPALSSSR